ncbi:MAG TPA: hypothetical protein VF099_14045, partial [Ktedonobacterales bacterium]
KVQEDDTRAANISGRHRQKNGNGHTYDYCAEHTFKTRKREEVPSSAAGYNTARGSIGQMARALKQGVI